MGKTFPYGQATPRAIFGALYHVIARGNVQQDIFIEC